MITISISADSPKQVRHAMEAIWVAITKGQDEHSIKPFKLPKYDILVRRGEGDDYGAVVFDK
jgi:hypothetical protein